MDKIDFKNVSLQIVHNNPKHENQRHHTRLPRGAHSPQMCGQRPQAGLY